MPYSIETSRRNLMDAKPDDEDLLFDLTEQLTLAYTAQDSLLAMKVKEGKRQRYLFAYRGQKRHESRPHHLQASPVKAEAILTGQPTIAPWRR